MNDAVSRTAILEMIDSIHIPSGLVARTTKKVIRDAVASLPSEGTGAQRVHDFYKAWDQMETGDIYSAQTVASIIADVAGMLGIKVEEDGV